MQCRTLVLFTQRTNDSEIARQLCWMCQQFMLDAIALTRFKKTDLGGLTQTRPGLTHAKQANNAHDDQVDRDDVVQQAWHQQNQNAGDQGDDRADAE